MDSHDEIMAQSAILPEVAPDGSQCLRDSSRDAEVAFWATYGKFPWNSFYGAPEPTDVDYNPKAPAAPFGDESVPQAFTKGTEEYRERAAVLKEILNEVAAVLLREYTAAQAKHALIIEEYNQVAWNLLMLAPKQELRPFLAPVHFLEEDGLRLCDKADKLENTSDVRDIMHSRNFYYQERLIQEKQELEITLKDMEAKLEELVRVFAAKVLEDARATEDRDSYLKIRQTWREFPGYGAFRTRPLVVDLVAQDSDADVSASDYSADSETADEAESSDDGDDNNESSDDSATSVSGGEQAGGSDAGSSDTDGGAPLNDSDDSDTSSDTDSGGAPLDEPDDSDASTCSKRSGKSAGCCEHTSCYGPGPQGAYPQFIMPSGQSWYPGMYTGWGPYSMPSRSQYHPVGKWDQRPDLSPLQSRNNCSDEQEYEQGSEVRM